MWRRAALVGLLACGWIAAPSAAAPGTPSTCAPPYQPIYADADQEGSLQQTYPPEPVDPPDLDGRSLDVAVEPGWHLDSDGDGHDDVVDYDGRDLVIRRTSGTLRLTSSHGGDPTWTSAEGAFAPGDLDGDGREDLLVHVGGEDDGRWFAVSGATPDGSWDVWDIGVLLPGRTDYPSGEEPGVRGGVGEQLGAPGTDVLARDAGGSGVVDGAALLAPGAGQELASFPISAPVDGELRLRIDLGGDHTAFLVAAGDYTVGATALRVWRDGQVLELVPHDGAGYLAYEHFSVVESPAGRLLVSTTSSRGGETWRIVWNLDHPCGPGSTAVWSGATPGPATPISGDAGYTG